MNPFSLQGKDVYRCKFCDMPFSVPSTLEKHMRKCMTNNSSNAVAAAASNSNNTSGATASASLSNNTSSASSALSKRPSSNGSSSATPTNPLSLMNGLTSAAAGPGLLNYGLGNANSLLLNNQLLNNIVNSARNSTASSLFGTTASNLLSMGFNLGAHVAGNEVDA